MSLRHFVLCSVMSMIFASRLCRTGSANNLPLAHSHAPGVGVHRCDYLIQQVRLHRFQGHGLLAFQASRCLDPLFA